MQGVSRNFVLQVSTIPSRSNLIGLPVAERKFAESILAMGFGERQVLLAIQKCGHKNREVRNAFSFLYACKRNL